MKYTVYGVLHLGVFTVVEAENEAQSREIAAGKDVETCAEYCSYHEEGRELEMWCLQDGTNGDVEIDHSEGSVEPEEA